MKYRILGRSGLKVSEVCLGTMTFGEEWGFGASKEESRKQFDVYAGTGGNFIDTANVRYKGHVRALCGRVREERSRPVRGGHEVLHNHPPRGHHRLGQLAQESGSVRGCLLAKAADLGFPHEFLARPSMARTPRGDLGDKLVF